SFPTRRPSDLLLPDAVCLPQPGPGRTHGARPVAAAAADARCHGRLAETGPGLPGLLLPGSTGCGAAVPVLDARGPGDRRTARFRRPGPGHAGPADGVRPVLRAAVGPVLAHAGPGGLARPAPAPGAVLFHGRLLAQQIPHRRICGDLGGRVLRPG